MMRAYVCAHFVVAAGPREESCYDEACPREVGDARQLALAVAPLERHPEEEDPALCEQAVACVREGEREKRERTTVAMQQ